jgi:hypothetical protein
MLSASRLKQKVPLLGNRTRKPLFAILFVLALLPSAWLAWNWRAMPQLGYYHDDSIYWVTAKSLAHGDGYRIASLPQQPLQTKYPPLYPALLSLVWRINPNFPANLSLATLFAWLLFPPFIWLSWRFFNQQRFSPWECLVLTTLAAFNPVAILLSVSLMSELLFTCLFVGALLLAERASEEGSPIWLAAAAGLLGGLAYLTRSAAMCLLVGVPLAFLLQRRLRQALVFAACMLPAALAWQAWTWVHVSHARDLVTLYYTNYFGFQLYNVPVRDLPLVVWQNLANILAGITKLLIFDVDFENVNVQRLVGVAALAGVVRLARQSRRLHFPLTAGVFIVMLLIWHYPPDQRLVFPLYPLLLAGLWTELKNVVLVLRPAWQKKLVAERAVAVLVGTVLASLALFVIFTAVRGDFIVLPDLLGRYRGDLLARQPAYAWIEENTPENANVYAYDDPVLFLYATRKSCSFHVPPRLIYHRDDAGIVDLLHTLPEFVHRQQLNYVLVTGSDFHLDLREQGVKGIADALRHTDVFEPVMRFPGSAIYRVLP